MSETRRPHLPAAGGPDRAGTASGGPSRRLLTTLIVVVAMLVIAALVLIVVLLEPRQPAPVATDTTSPTPSTTPSASPSPTPTPTPTFDKTQHSIDDPTSIWVVVNKKHALDPQNYAPSDLVNVPVKYVNFPQLRKVASDHIVEMFAAFTAETGLEMQAQSSYRSYAVQVDVYNGWVRSLGQKAADLTSARPGHSEHQTGLVMDISAVPAVCALDQCFADTPQGEWLAANAYKYGFILRYPEGLTDITGYEFEPWHYRYVGVELATEMHDEGIQTLEEFFGLPAAPDYD